MSSSNQVLAQNATQLSISTPSVSDADLLVNIVEKNARRKVKPNTITQDRWLVNKSKLFSACAAEYKSCRGIGKNDRLDNETAAKLDEMIDSFINKQLSLITTSNALSVRQYLHHDVRNRRVTKRTQATGEDMIALKEQVLGMNIIIDSLEKRLKDLEAKPNPDYDRENSVKDSIREAEFTRSFIQARMADLAKAEAAQPQQ